MSGWWWRKVVLRFLYGYSVCLNTCLTRARDLRVRLGPAIKAEPVCCEELAYVSFETLKLRTNRGSGSSPSPAEFCALAPISRRRRSPTAKGHHILAIQAHNRVNEHGVLHAITLFWAWFGRGERLENREFDGGKMSWNQSWINKERISFIQNIFSGFKINLEKSRCIF